MVSYGATGAGLTRFLSGSHEQVVELDRPKRAARRHGAKSDPLDATRAAWDVETVSTAATLLSRFSAVHRVAISAVLAAQVWCMVQPVGTRRAE